MFLAEWAVLGYLGELTLESWHLLVLKVVSIFSTTIFPYLGMYTRAGTVKLRRKNSSKKVASMSIWALCHYRKDWRLRSPFPVVKKVSISQSHNQQTSASALPSLSRKNILFSTAEFLYGLKAQLSWMKWFWIFAEERGAAPVSWFHHTPEAKSILQKMLKHSAPKGQTVEL